MEQRIQLTTYHRSSKRVNQSCRPLIQRLHWNRTTILKKLIRESILEITSVIKVDLTLFFPDLSLPPDKLDETLSLMALIAASVTPFAVRGPL